MHTTVQIQLMITFITLRIQLTAPIHVGFSRVLVLYSVMQPELLQVTITCILLATIMLHFLIMSVDNPTGDY